jgi:cardiolipin synthase
MAVVAVIGCRPEPPIPAPHVTADTVTTELTRHTGAQMRLGNAVELVQNGDVFDVLERDIRNARSSVHIVSFIWRGEEGPSERLGRELLARRAGVDCRIVIDAFGSLKFSKRLEESLRRSGCEIRRRGSLYVRPFAREHRKIAVIDGEVGITGGWGIWKSWEGQGLAHDQWRESSARVRGPVVADMQRAFEDSWRKAGGQPLPPAAYPDLPAAGSVTAGFVASAAREDRPSAAEMMTHLLARVAERELWIANSYFIPDDRLQRVLIDKRQSGVDVRVLAAGPVHDLPLVRAAQRQTYETLLPAGVRVWEYQPSMMHSKTMVVDGRFVVIGSTNVDGLSFHHMEEGSLVADTPEVAAELETLFRRDLARAQEITPDAWRKRDIAPELARELAGLLRDFL